MAVYRVLENCREFVGQSLRRRTYPAWSLRMLETTQLSVSFRLAEVDGVQRERSQWIMAPLMFDSRGQSPLPINLGHSLQWPVLAMLLQAQGDGDRCPVHQRPAIEVGSLLGPAGAWVSCTSCFQVWVRPCCVASFLAVQDVFCIVLVEWVCSCTHKHDRNNIPQPVTMALGQKRCSSVHSIKSHVLLWVAINHALHSLLLPSFHAT